MRSIMRSLNLAFGFVLTATVAAAQSYPSPTISGLTLFGASGNLTLGNQAYAAGSSMRQDWLWSDGVFNPATLGGLWPTSTYAWSVLNKTFTASSVTGQGTLYSPIANGPLSTQFKVTTNNGATADVVTDLNFCQVTGASGGTCFGGNDIVFVGPGKSAKLIGREIDLEFAVGSTDAGGSIGIPINVFSIASDATASLVAGVGGGSWSNGFVSQNIRNSHYSVNSGDPTTSASFINTQNGTFSNGAIVLGRGAAQSISFGGLGFGTSPLAYADTSNNLQFQLGSTSAAQFRKSDGTVIASVSQDGFSLLSITVASLTTCGAGSKGLIKAVSDGTASLAWGATVTGGGSTYYTVNCNGTNWTVMGK